MEIFSFDSLGRDKHDKKMLTLNLSVPGEEEECGIGMDLIAEYRLEWLPRSVANCVIEEAPALTKATIASCGHGFNAMALLYHFMRNEMTCPFCRGGFKGSRMYWQLIPPHLRGAMRERLDTARLDEQRVRIAEDAMAAWGVLASDPRGIPISFFTTVRHVLLVYAYRSEDAVAPILAKEVVLETSHILGAGAGAGMRMRPYVQGMRDLTRTMRMAGLASGNLEIVVASRDRRGEVLTLLRSRRFRVGTTSPECVDADLARIQLQWSGDGDLVGFELTLPLSTMTVLLARGVEAVSDERGTGMFQPMP